MVFDINTHDVVEIPTCGKCLGPRKNVDTQGMRQCDNCEKFLYDIDERYQSKKRTCENLKEANRKLKKELDDLKTHVKYMPNGDGYEKAKESFENNIEK